MFSREFAILIFVLGMIVFSIGLVGYITSMSDIHDAKVKLANTDKSDDKWPSPQYEAAKEALFKAKKYFREFSPRLLWVMIVGGATALVGPVLRFAGGKVTKPPRGE